ncbi:MAG: biotin--[acetyl-CoA-carboxylase] ligase [Nitrospira sp.]|uniref:Biotin--(Acetyl-CoA-carboxylase) ligase n=1 Tax=Nitrospira defluvii TaxID=330214 RepID=A0ABM8R2H2_9BACT|nr:biotin--[acetyl-CoA-carboxylase] ligase [Nitrospira defluvii]MCS6328985.1 biotin--[acetyl-CoA-carboxylase] ligase [Nitrospira sp.]CAE6729333.1 Biotin--(acetyl-CoA-carboxylase) ligase [Nitrospira defluvii]
MPEAADHPPFADQLNLDRLKASLRTRAFGRVLRYTTSTLSTNADALLALQQSNATPIPHGSVFLTECQTAGRGRRGRTWHSPPQGNIYTSLVVLPTPGGTRVGPWLSWIPLFTALATADALAATTGLPISVKWPNDLLIDTKKIGGILCEQTTRPDKTVAVVIGIGLNINAPLDSFPEELTAGATTLAVEGGRPVDRVALLAELFLRLEQRLDRLLTDGPTGMIDEFTQRCSTLGKTVRVSLEQGRIVEGVAESIGPDGCLRIRVISDSAQPPASSLLEVRSAEVVHLRG